MNEHSPPSSPSDPRPDAGVAAARPYVVVRGERTFAHYLESHCVGARPRRLVLRSLAVGIGICLTLQPAWASKAVGGLAIAYGLIGSDLLFRWRVRRLWEAYPAMQRKGMLEIRVSAAGLESPDDSGTLALTRWDKFLKWRESTGLFLLYFSPNLWIFLPKELLTASEVSTLRKILAENLTPPR